MRRRQAPKFIPIRIATAITSTRIRTRITPKRIRTIPRHTPLNWLDRHFSGIGVYQLVRPLVVGLVHGLCAGSAAVALLVLTTIRDPWWATAYLAIFGVGTIAGMMLITAAIGVPFAYAGKMSLRLNWGIRVASGLISLGFGLFLAYQIGFVGGLFTGHPHWTPR